MSVPWPSALAAVLPACSAIWPRQVSLGERVDALPRTGLPLRAPVTVRFNDRQVPYLEAATDHDLAFALGLVHAHLRLGQLELLRHLVQGRISEMAGPFTNDLDHALRTLDLGRAAARILAVMDPGDRAFLSAFVDGLNWTVANARVPPPEFALLGLRPEPFTAEVVIAMSRLAGVDVNWLVLFPLLKARGRPDFEAIWARTLEAGCGITPGGPSWEERLVAGSRSGSNALVVSPARSTTGAALIAGDAHLGITLPNFWLLAGLSSPSYHAVGLMIPGVPVVAVGRSERVAWGGTNMRGASSDLVDLTHRDDARITSRPIRIRTRGFRDARRTVRDSRFGPIVSDLRGLGAQPGETLALRWTGHDPSDETGAFLRAMRARDVDEFRDAFAGFAVSPQNMLAADVEGNIAHVFAARLPRRTWRAPPGPVIDADLAEQGWAAFAGTRDLPYRKNPPEGFLASANDRPAAQGEVPLGWFFSARERVERLRELLGNRPQVSPEDLKALQRDAVSRCARDLAAELLAQMDGVPSLARRGPTARATLRGWDGSYDAGEAAPVVFETLLHRLVPVVYGARRIGELPPHVQSWSVLVKVLPADLSTMGQASRAAAFGRALDAAERNLRRYPTWGDMHKLEVASVLSRLPILGRAFRHARFPASGSRETILKTAHGFADREHVASYGSQARHVSDLSDPDESWFVLLGGEDGWLGSDTFRDQVDVWRRSEYVRMPLRPQTVAAEFPHVVTLEPGR